MSDSDVLMAVCITVIAFLYASVGHAGASGYIAVMALFGLAPTTIKPTALILNILVASIGSWQFWRSGRFSWRLFYPFALLSVPMAFLGGYINLPSHWFKTLLGIILWLSAIWFFSHPEEIEDPQPPATFQSLGVGAGIGLLAGFTGTGGGIFLTPIAIAMRWAKMKTISAISVTFILVNSIAGLFGNFISVRSIPTVTPILAIAAMIGGLAGSYLGSQKFSSVTIKRILSIVLLIAGYKLIVEGTTILFRSS